jgi:hypothetical protein
LKKGEDVEMGWVSGNGGHVVDLIGGGTILGVPWVSFIQDANQGQDGGTNWFDGGVGFSLFSDQNILATWVGGTTQATLDFAFSESVPKPSTWAMMLLGFAGIGFAGLSECEERTAGARDRVIGLGD